MAASNAFGGVLYGQLPVRTYTTAFAGVTSGADLLNTGGPHCPSAILYPQVRGRVARIGNAWNDLFFCYEMRTWSCDFFRIGRFLGYEVVWALQLHVCSCLQKLRNPNMVRPWDLWRFKRKRQRQRTGVSAPHGLWWKSLTWLVPLLAGMGSPRLRSGQALRLLRSQDDRAC
jgi:hypothetical protein